MSNFGPGSASIELAELRPRDLNPATCMLTISRVAVEVNPKFHPEHGLPARLARPPGYGPAPDVAPVAGPG